MDKVTGFYEIIAGESTALGKLLSKIPGLSGYMERDQRREADQLLRETIGGRLQEVRIELSGVHRELSRDIVKGVEYAEDLGRADNQLMGLIGKIQNAPVGYAGFFDAIKVDAEDLARLYHFDSEMLNYTDQIGSDVAALQKAVESDMEISEAIKTLNTHLREANQTFNSRQEVLNQIK